MPGLRSDGRSAKARTIEGIRLYHEWRVHEAEQERDRWHAEANKLMGMVLDWGCEVQRLRRQLEEVGK